jgi:hypothetical protein
MLIVTPAANYQKARIIAFFTPEKYRRNSTNQPSATLLITSSIRVKAVANSVAGYDKPDLYHLLDFLMFLLFFQLFFTTFFAKKTYLCAISL